MRSVLISGGGIAGLVLADSLRRQGFAVTIVERASKPRTTGQAVDIRGAALTAMDRLGYRAELESRRTRLKGMSWLNGAGVEQWRREDFVLSSGRLDSPDIEILRAELTEVLQAGLLRTDAAREDDGSELVFGDWITGLTDGPDGVDIQFAQTAPHRFDLVVGADGLYSGVRRLAFGPAERYLHHLGAYLGVFGGPNLIDLEDWQVWVQDPAATYVVYPTRDNSEVRVTVGFESPAMTVDYRDEPQHRQLVADRIARIPWQTDALRKTLEASADFQFGAMAQARLGSWSSGRVALIGDAASCPSPLTGQGTSVAIIQAYVLAQELARNAAATDGHTVAYRRYEERLRGFVDLNQALIGPEGQPAEEGAVDKIKDAVDLDA
ncbi:FAD-dependent monooxygenase [Microlunatus speluncae]|uniref:FAD-dependent monooxygenase n=1 Tax=Microlunatus speluncae TaxID=2594267 RepID=UPI0012667248|nr:FAD-dependent monooxygenase [Microlunatus speluncae]